jgi:hypothetical protein
VDNPADKSLNSDGPHQLSISGQSVPRDGAASHFQPQKQHTNFSYTPPPWASRAPTPDNYQLRDTSLTQTLDDIVGDNLHRRSSGDREMTRDSGSYSSL